MKAVCAAFVRIHVGRPSARRADRARGAPHDGGAKRIGRARDGECVFRPHLPSVGILLRMRALPRPVLQPDAQHGRRHAEGKGEQANDDVRPRAVP